MTTARSAEAAASMPTMRGCGGDEGFELLCRATHVLIDQLYRDKFVIEKALIEGSVRVGALNYPPFLNTIEIIP